MTAETEDFDPDVPQQWADEGFRTVYVPLLNGGNEFIQRVHAAGDGFDVGEYYGIVGNAPEERQQTLICLGADPYIVTPAFGDAAALILEAHTKPNNPKLCVSHSVRDPVSV